MFSPEVLLWQYPGDFQPHSRYQPRYYDDRFDRERDAREADRRNRQLEEQIFQLKQQAQLAEIERLKEKVNSYKSHGVRQRQRLEEFESSQAEVCGRC